jgi:hypothetical protein
MRRCRVACRVICREIRATRHHADVWNQWLKPHLSGLSGFYSRRERRRNRIFVLSALVEAHDLCNIFFLLDLLDALVRR